MKTVCSVLLMMMVGFSLMGRVALAQETDHAHDLLYIGIDPQTLDAGKNSDLYLVRSDGSRVTNLTDSPLDSENQAYWSNDGKQIYFSRNSVGVYPGHSEEQSSTSFYVMDVSEAGEKVSERLLFHLSDVMGQPVRVEDWALSPDKQKVVFIPYDESLGGTYVVNIDGTDLWERFPNGVVSTYIPLQWSPDSREFAYETNECLMVKRDNTCPYWVAQADGDVLPDEVGTLSELMARWHSGEVYVVYNGGTFEIQGGVGSLWVVDGQIPDVSPDKRQVAFVEYKSNLSKWLLKVSDIRDNHPVQIAESEEQLFHVHWSPDGAQIAFAVYKGTFNDLEIYVVDPDGGGFKELFRGQTWSRDPLAWRPDTPPKVGN